MNSGEPPIVDSDGSALGGALPDEEGAWPGSVTAGGPSGAHGGDGATLVPPAFGDGATAAAGAEEDGDDASVTTAAAVAAAAAGGGARTGTAQAYT